MAKKQWSTTFDEKILREFQKTCEKYNVNRNVVLESLMKFFCEGNCKLIIDKDGCKVETHSENEMQIIQAQIAELQEKLKTI